MNQHAGKKAVVIGGTHGMGEAIARALLAGGAEVLVTGRNAQNVEPARRTLERAHVVQSDVARSEDIASLALEVERRLGAIDALFVNVGIAELGLIEAVSEESFDRQFGVNTRGAFFTAQRLVPLVRDGGALVFTTVTPGTATPAMAVYVASKAALRAFARGLAVELLGRRIRVNTVAPGFIATPTLGVASATPEQRREFARIGDQITPMKRHGSADEVARAALFLAFEATFTTGAELPVDGGLSQVDAPHEVGA